MSATSSSGADAAVPLAKQERELVQFAKGAFFVSLFIAFVALAMGAHAAF